MSKILEFETVYLELPDEYELEDEKKERTNEEALEITQRMTLEELQQKLEETQSLHL